ncbi:MAG: hypothetical protein AAGK00_17465, partial [Pseudomonadota bacterium]
ILNAELVEQRPLRNLPRPHHPLDPPVLGSIESGAHSYFKAGFFNTILREHRMEPLAIGVTSRLLLAEHPVLN